MFKIPKIEKSSYYIDKAIHNMEKFALIKREEIQERFDKSLSTKRKGFDVVKLNKRKDLELEKIRFLNEKINTDLKKIIKRFPKFDKINPVYTKLINTTQIKVSQTKDDLAKILWIINKSDEFTENFLYKIKKSNSQKTIGFLMGKYLGKINSLFRKNKTLFSNLDKTAQFMNKLPEFKNLFTVAIGGFPNVGKSTLMKKITNSKVEIKNYPFTTKGLMFGYINVNQTKQIQFIDTPGLLGRNIQNNIEKRAQIILSEYANFIVFVLDFTQTCGFEIKSQIKLLKQTFNTNKNIVIYLSKKDIYDDISYELEKENKNILKKFKTFDDFQLLKKYIINQELKNKKFDVEKIKIIK